MSYKETLAYLFEQLPMFQRIGAAAYKPDIGNISALCSILENPQDSYPTIHIAGTNGKGSVTHILAAILQAQGYKVGVYTSPHYKDYRERIKINGKLISKDFVVKFIHTYKEKFAQIDASFFEITNAMAFYYFKEKKVDVAIIETGMGGRLDSTNIISPLVSIITNISFDHTQFLGDTLAKIATEKAGIIKPNTPVVIGETQPETKPVFIAKSKSENASICFAAGKKVIKDFKTNFQFSSFIYNKKTLKTDIIGSYQAKNINTALSALPFIKNKIKISDIAIKKGVANIKQSTYFIGRWMMVNENPITIFDSAHNEAGIKELMAQIKKINYRQLHIVYGTVSDKNIQKIASFLPKKANYYFCKPNIPRGKDITILQEEMAQHKLHGKTFTSVKKAFNAAKKAAISGDVILVTGSIFVVAEVL